jgi:paraquat-inducible protein A
MRRAVPWLLFISTISLGLAMNLPLMQTSAFYFFEDNPSIVGLIATLYGGNEWLLLGVITLFAVALPTFKLLVLHQAAYTGEKGRAFHILAALGRWSLLDVLVVALIIVAVKSSGLAAAASQPGLWFFAIHALTAAMISEVLKW